MRLTQNYPKVEKLVFIVLLKGGKYNRVGLRYGHLYYASIKDRDFTRISLYAVVALQIE